MILKFTPSCDKCAKPNAKSKCAQCKCLFYCNRNCQKLDWAEHKAVCQRLVEFCKEAEKHVFLSEEAKKLLGEGSECAICLETIANPVLLPCKHQFCFPCIKAHNYSRDLEGTCPLCRSQLPRSLHQFTYNNVAMFLRRACLEPAGSANRLLHVGMAEMEINKIPVADLSYSALQSHKQYLGDIHMGKEEFEEALRVYDSIDLSVYEPESLPLVIIHIQRGKALMGLKRYYDAIDALKEAARNSIEAYMSEFHDILHLTSKCKLKVGRFDEAIEFGLEALEMNRHYKGTYKTVALSYKGLGKVVEAAMTMQRAVYYETPWDLENVQKVKQLSEQLSKEANDAMAVSMNALLAEMGLENIDKLGKKGGA